MRWNIDEEKNLINEVNRCKELSLSCREAFVAHCKKYNRTLNSVKGHYYSLKPRGDKNKLRDIFCDLIDKQNVVNIKDYQRQVLTESDIQALLRGVLKLIEEQTIRD